MYRKLTCVLSTYPSESGSEKGICVQEYILFNDVISIQYDVGCPEQCPTFAGVILFSTLSL